MPDDLRATATQHWLESGKREHAISVLAHRTRDADWIVRRARRSDPESLQHPVVRQTTAGAIRQAGYDVVPHGRHPRGHALILLSTPPSPQDWPRISSLFGQERPNPTLN
jgi:hypothetical protein